jgi:hypothetical protein
MGKERGRKDGGYEKGSREEGDTAIREELEQRRTEMVLLCDFPCWKIYYCIF